MVERAEHLRLRLADRKATHRVAVEADLDEPFRRAGSFGHVGPALHDAELEPRVRHVLEERAAGAGGPVEAQRDGAGDGLRRGRKAHALVELHLDVGAELQLDRHRLFGRQPVHRPVDMALEGHPVVVDLPQR